MTDWRPITSRDDAEPALRCGGCGISKDSLGSCTKCGYDDYYPPIQVWQPVDSGLRLYNTVSGGIRIDHDTEDATIVQIAAEDLWRIPTIIIMLWEFVKTLPVEQ